MIQDFMAGSLFDCYQASTIEFETPRTDRNQRFIHITQHRTDKREEDRLGMGREGLGLRGRPFVRNCASSPMASLLPLNRTCLEYFNLCL